MMEKHLTMQPVQIDVEIFCASFRELKCFVFAKPFLHFVNKNKSEERMHHMRR